MHRRKLYHNCSAK